MRKPATKSISDHRLRRLATWAGLMLAAVAQLVPLPAFAQWVDYYVPRLARMTANLIVIQAVRRIRGVRVPKRWGPRPDRAGYMRTVIGSRLRRALNGRNIVARMIAIGQALTDPEPHIARLARRLARGLSRRRPIRARRSADAIAQPFTPTHAALADTS
jgi:hypothetical protein